MSIQRRIALLVASGTLLIGLSCVTPTVPIPPPTPEAMAFDVDIDMGLATFEYNADPTFANAIVYVFNRDSGSGIITTANNDGSVSPTEPFAGQENDEVVITFEVEGVGIASTCVRLAQGQSDSSRECQ